MTKYRDDRDIVGDMLTEGAKDLTYALFKATRRFKDDLYRQRKEKEMEERIFKRVLDRIQIEVVNEAGPVIKELQQQIRSLGN